MPKREVGHPAFPNPLLLAAAVIAAVSSISFASIFVRLADAPPAAVAAYRVSIAVAAIAPYLAWKGMGEKTSWTLRAFLLSALSGVFLASHFLFWIHSLYMTSVACSAALVGTIPLFTALFSRYFRHEPLNRSMKPGLFLAVSGSALVAGLDFTLSTTALLGDILAILGAVMAAAYLECGRVARRSLGAAPYAFAVYGSAALVLLASCAASNTPLTGFTPQTYLFLVLLALIPQLIGHTTFNWTLRFLPPTLVAVLILGEPVGATILAWVLLGETVSLPKAAGLVVLGTGILIASMSLCVQDQGDMRSS